MREILRGDTANSRLSSAAFDARWRALSAACPWSTVYQEPAFVRTWYAAYRDEVEPVVVCESDAAGDLRGLLFLAVERASGRLVTCGASQAEYDVWLARPDDGSAFIEAAWDTLKAAFPHGRINFLFLPPKAPMTFSARWEGRCTLRPFSRPLFATTPDSTEAQASLKKKGNKSKLNQLKRAGALTFARVTEAAAFDALLDEMVPLFDARQATLNGAPPFGGDPRRRDFFRAMFRADILHVTVLRVGGRLAASHIGHVNRGQVVLGLIAHSPFFAKYSVGKFLMLLLAVELQKEGFEAFDLTPAGDYKDRFATHADTAHVLTVHLSPIDARRYRVQRALIDAGKRYWSSDQTKAAFARVRHVARLMRPGDVPRQAARAFQRLIQPSRELRIYTLDAAAAASRPATTSMRRDALEDLLCYSPSEPSQPAYGEFLAVALERLGDGWHAYTRVEDGRLIQWGWLVEPEPLKEGTPPPDALPPGAARLVDFCTHASYRGRGLFGRGLVQVAADAGRTPGVSCVTITTPAAGVGYQKAIERAGFVYWRSTVAERRVAAVTTESAPTTAPAAPKVAAGEPASGAAPQT